jgi:hypothetical protein
MRRLLGSEFLQGGTCVIVAGLVGPPRLNRFQSGRRVKSPSADRDPVSGEPRLPEKRGAAFLAERVSCVRHGIEPSQSRICILDREVGDIGRCGGHVVTREAPAPVAMAVEDVPKVSEDLEGNHAAQAPPRCPGSGVHASRLTPGDYLAGCEGFRGGGAAESTPARLGGFRSSSRHWPLIAGIVPV